MYLSSSAGPLRVRFCVYSTLAASPSWGRFCEYSISAIVPLWVRSYPHLQVTHFHSPPAGGPFLVILRGPPLVGPTVLYLLILCKRPPFARPYTYLPTAIIARFSPPIVIACRRAPPVLFIQSKHSRARHPLLAQPLDSLLPRYLHAGGKLGKTPGRWRSGSNTRGGWGQLWVLLRAFLWLNRLSQGVSRWDKLCARALLETKFMSKWWMCDINDTQIRHLVL